MVLGKFTRLLVVTAINLRLLCFASGLKEEKYIGGPFLMITLNKWSKLCNFIVKTPPKFL